MQEGKRQPFPKTMVIAAAVPMFPVVALMKGHSSCTEKEGGTGK